MVNFWVYDVLFLLLFTLFVTWFLYKNRKALSREGIIFMYRTQFGIDLIKKVGDKYKRLLNGLKYVIISIGFVLMSVMVWMLGQTMMIYIRFPQVTDVIKAPPIAPLIPYFPKLFGMEQFFPPFYFTYFLVALAIVAISHEFSHGIFMRLFKVKIKSTGLVFLGPILGAFVEQDDKDFHKKKKSEQMAVLGAGVFANLLVAILFYLLYVLFFYSSFTASGYVFNSYGSVNAIPVVNISSFETFEHYTKINTKDNISYYVDESLGVQDWEGISYIFAYSESPALKAQMKGSIIEAEGVAIKNGDDLRKYLEDKEPGEKATFLVEGVEGEKGYYEITLGNHPEDNSKPYLGVGSYQNQPSGVVQKLLVYFMSFKDSSTLYKPSWDGNFVYFIYHLLWWVMIINLLVALFNMMPLGMLDGGRFFYLGVLAITGSERFAKWAFKFVGYAILFVFVLLMFFWFIRIV